MKTTAILSAFVCLPLMTQAATLTRAQASPLLEQVAELNDQCRGGSGGDPRTTAACDKRDAVADKLYQSGWCYGDTDQDGYQKYWKTCGEGRRQELRQLATAYGVTYGGTYTAAISRNAGKSLDWYKGKAFELDQAYIIEVCTQGKCYARKANDDGQASELSIYQEKGDYKGRWLQGDYLRVVGLDPLGAILTVRLWPEEALK